ncbi:MAG: ATP-binding cassette domain-containing protein [Chloroflexota bacterium]|jgi:ABC-2 type transport system ATP-binding protein|nr:ATP-binding cassette domain-containing protein [Chloroflexota bacterium]
MPAAPAIMAEELTKSFGKTHALNGVSIDVPEGAILALLGPNGAGKTTTVRILTTLSKPDSGRATVAGYDVIAEPAKVRSNIGVTGQSAALDELLTGRENMEMIGRLYRLSAGDAKRRAQELLERFRLTDAASRIVKTYSGGMRRRLDLAASLIAAPPVLFLDEPTTGLDPRSRLEMWALIEELVAGGTTLLLTTQYLEEADQLANDIAVVDHGKIIARGTPEELKSQVGGERIELTLAPGSDLAEAARILIAQGGLDPQINAEKSQVTAPISARPGLTTTIAAELHAVGIGLDAAALLRPTLDDVFLTLTGHAAVEDEEEAA